MDAKPTTGRLRRLWNSNRHAWHWSLDSWENWKETSVDYYDDLQDRVSDYWFDKQFQVVFGTILQYIRYSWRRKLEDVTSKYAVKCGIACVLVTASVTGVVYYGRKSGYLNKFYLWWKTVMNRRQNDLMIKLDSYAIDHSSSLLPMQKKFLKDFLCHEQSTTGKFHQNQFHLLQLIFSSMASKNGLIIGMKTGYSSLSLAFLLSENGKLVVCTDALDSLPENLLTFLKEVGIDNKIKFIEQCSCEAIDDIVNQELIEMFDFAVIDTEPEMLSTAYDKCLPLLRPGGAVIVKNVLNQEEVISGDGDSEMNMFNERCVRDDRVRVTMLPYGHGGLSVLIKRADQ